MQTRPLQSLSLRKSERRRAKRFFADEQVVLYLRPSDWTSKGEVLAARVLDVSRHGLRIAHHRPLSTGSNVLVLTPEWEANGEIVWTRGLGSHFESGVATGVALQE